MENTYGTVHDRLALQAPGLHQPLVAQHQAPSTCLDLVIGHGSLCTCVSPGLGRDKCHPGPLCKESCFFRHQHLGCDNRAGPPARATVEQTVHLVLHCIQIAARHCWRWLGYGQKPHPSTEGLDQTGGQRPFVSHSKFRLRCEEKEGRTGNDCKREPCPGKGCWRRPRGAGRVLQGQGHRLQHTARASRS